MADEDSRVDVVVAVGLAGVEVPDVVGDSADEAKSTLEAAGLTVRAEEVFSDKVDKGDVVAQSPQPGTRVQKGAEVALSVSKGEEPAANVKVPDLSGMTEDEARAALDKVGLDGVDLLAYSATVPKGDVGAQAPAAGASVAPGTQVAFILSKGPAPSGTTEVKVPNVTGLPKDEAKSALDAAGFKTEEIESPHETVAEDNVIAQLPLAGQMATEGSVVVIMVSTGPAQ
jgi:serine/threonine-protein kinase